MELRKILIAEESEELSMDLAERLRGRCLVKICRNALLVSQLLRELRPDLLVLDEPFKGMDEALRARVLQTVAGTKAAVLLVTHDEWEAKALGCRIWML